MIFLHNVEYMLPSPTEAPKIPRILALDVLRGFALGGILMVNILGMAYLFKADSPSASGFVNLFFQGKFYVLFSFLFGYSFTMQMRSADRDGASRTGRMVRRCVALIVLGALHLVFLWLGDILLVYGIAGLALLVLSRLSPKAALIVGGVILTAISALTVFAGGDGSENGPMFTPAEKATLLADYRGDFLSAAEARLEVFGALGFGSPVATALAVLPLFLFGLAAGKVRLLEDPAKYTRLLPRAQWIGLGIGGSLTLALNISQWTDTAPENVAVGISILASPLLAMGYAATVLRIAHHLKWFAAAGKIAATNYIAQSVITAILFTGAGFALADRLPAWIALAIAATIFLAQLAFSAWWTRNHRYGPIEWLLRKATYAFSPSHPPHSPQNPKNSHAPQTPTPPPPTNPL
ncbi:DUF418 domain-containing protein [Sinosporangium siamense]|uniref:DUF418 domain-containing protein n=1 Tax=Sinosporangium siamense TaxID=1367973 RepID=UPI00195125A2|nr:DUF418 domain-containing protein [Sinosporangium siamense]